MTGDDHVLARDLAGQAGSGCSSCGLRAATRTCCARPATGCRTSSSSPSWPAARPGDVVLSEEGADDPARLAARRVWIVDPLDGTREFGEPGRTDWAVHVALWDAERQPTAATSPPARSPSPPRDRSCPRPSRRRVRSRRRAGRGAGKIRIVVSRSRPPRFVRNISESY